MTDEQQETSIPTTNSDDQPSGAEATEADLRRELEEARAKAAEYYQSWQRTAADFSNFKRRVDEDKKFGQRWIIQDLFPVLDDFERAWLAIPSDLRKFSWLEGIFQIYSKLYTVLQRHGVSPIEAQDKTFSPLEHEAVLHEEDVELSEQTVVMDELQRGYRLHERVLRASLVKVGRPRPETASSQTGEPKTES
jgi:molecular chaperone GrpE